METAHPAPETTPQPFPYRRIGYPGLRVVSRDRAAASVPEGKWIASGTPFFTIMPDKGVLMFWKMKLYVAGILVAFAAEEWLG